MTKKVFMESNRKPSPPEYEKYATFIEVFGPDIVPFLEECRRRSRCGIFERAEMMALFIHKSDHLEDSVDAGCKTR